MVQWSVSRSGAARGLRRLVVPIGAVLAVVVGLLPGTPAGAAEADLGARLGRSAPEAAVSCWDIKQKDPSAGDGSYWLLTPTMKAPAQFYCDMTTDGGGWVLVGRGREGWRFSYNGQGRTDQVSSVVDGPDAFSTRTLAAPVIDGLLDGGRVDQLEDGIRLRRATDISGAARQEVRFRPTNTGRWVWTFDAERRVVNFSFDAVAGTGGQTRSFGLDQAYRRVLTSELKSHGYTAGWGFGNTVAGVNSAESYVWSSTTEVNALPFTQVFVRPRLTAETAPFAAVPDAGLSADAQSRLLSNLSEPTAWGVTGRANGLTSELNTEVQAFAQSGNRMIVGGNFRYVQRDQSGTGQVEQPYLAAFDVDTGAWLPDFRPVLDGQVKDLQVRPDGTVVAAGEFTTVNGSPAVGLVSLNPVTGATDGSFSVAMENRITGQTASVRTLDAEGPWLYLGGRFTHLAGGSRQTPVYARMAARVSLADGTPDPDWNPGFSGSVVDVDASPAGDRVYFAGYFSQANGVAAPNVAVVTTAAGAGLVPGLGSSSFSTTTKQYQQVIREVGDRVWHGGAEHMLFSYGRSQFNRLSGNITKNGGDFQTINEQSGVVYGGCHCGNWVYSDTYTWPNPGTGWTSADNIRFVGAWDAATGNLVPDFVPGLTGARGQGPWAMVTDSRGRMWIGGDFVKSQTTGERWQWVGGFVRYSERDSVSPTTPGALSGTDAEGTTTLRWGAASDSAGPVTYEVLRYDRVVAATWDTKVSLPTPDGAARYFVRSVDAAGNRSATTAVHTVDPAAVDTTAPQVTITSPTAGATVSGAQYVVVAATDEVDDGPDALSVEVRVDSGSWQRAAWDAATSRYRSSWDTATVANGDHTLQARATDGSANVGTTAATVVTVSNAVAAPPPAGNVLASWSSGADSFDISSGSPPVVEKGGSYGERLRWTQQPDERAYAGWDGSRLGAGSQDGTVRWITSFSAFPTWSFVVAQGLDNRTTQQWRIEVTPAGEVRIRNNANTVTGLSAGGLPLDTEVRFEAVRAGNTMTVSVFSPPSSTTPLLSATGAVGTNVNTVRIGNFLRTPTVPTYTVDEIVVTDRAQLVGAP